MSWLNRLPPPLSPAARHFFRAWDGWRKGNTLPDRQDIAFGDLGPEMAEGCMNVQVHSRDNIEIVHAGPMLARLAGFDLTGYNYLDLTMPENRQFRVALTMEQLAQPCGFVLYYRLRHAGNAETVLEWVGAPACDSGATIPSLIPSCAIPLSRPTNGPAAVDPDSYRIADGMRFIDIGFGIPPLDPSAPQKLLWGEE